MKIEVSKNDLEPALALVSAGMSKEGGDITSHFLFRPAEGGAEVLTYNGRIGVAAFFAADVEGDEMFTVEGWRLRQWVKAAGDVTITLSEKEGKVSAKTPRSKGTFRSLDPDNFQFWDDTYRSAKVSSELTARALRDALNNAKNFIYEKDTQNPNYSLCEARDGVLLASDRRALSVSVVDGLSPDASFRIHHKDVPTVVSFLSGAGDHVELLEHDHALFIRSGEGKVLTVGKPNVEFPQIKYDLGDQDPIQWTLDKGEVLSGIEQLSATAEKADVKLRFKFNPKTSTVVMSMKSIEGTNDEVPLTTTEVSQDRDYLISKVRDILNTVHKDKIAGMSETEASSFLEKEAAGGAEKALVSFFDRGCLVDYVHLKKVLAGYEGDSVKVGVSPMGKGGFCRFKNVRATNDSQEETEVFLTMLAFVRDLSK
jgi:DNA polymerase III sliding clamp (beta) subunit (PCNA family)